MADLFSILLALGTKRPDDANAERVFRPTFPRPKLPRKAAAKLAPGPAGIKYNASLEI